MLRDEGEVTGWLRQTTSDKISLWGTSLFIRFSYFSLATFQEGNLISLYSWCHDICHLFNMPVIGFCGSKQLRLTWAPVTSKRRIKVLVAYGYFLRNIKNMKRALYKIRTYRALNNVSWCLFFLRFYWDSQWLYSSRSKKPRRGLWSL